MGHFTAHFISVQLFLLWEKADTDSKQPLSKPERKIVHRLFIIYAIQKQPIVTLMCCLDVIRMDKKYLLL